MALGTKSYALTMENGGKQLLERQIVGYVSANIDGKSIGNTTVFTSHADLGRFVVLEIVIYNVNINTLTLQPFFCFGTNAASYDNIAGPVQCVATSTDKYEVRIPGDTEATGSTAVAASTAVIARVDTAGTGTTLTYAVYIRGFYIG